MKGVRTITDATGGTIVDSTVRVSDEGYGTSSLGTGVATDELLTNKPLKTSDPS